MNKKFTLAAFVLGLILATSGISFAGGQEGRGKTLSEGTGTRGGKMLAGQEGKGRIGNGTHGRFAFLGGDSTKGGRFDGDTGVKPLMTNLGGSGAGNGKFGGGNGAGI